MRKKKQSVPIFSDEERDKSLIMMTQDFKMVIKDGHLSK